MADAPSDYDATNTASVTDDAGTNPTINDKAHAIKISEGTGTGTGDCQFSSSTWSNINGREDIGAFDTNDNALNFDIIKLDTTNNVAWIYVHVNSLTRDNTDQIKIAAGSGSTDDTNATATFDTSDTGQNVEAAWPLDESSGSTIDKTANNNDSNNTVGTTYQATGQIGDARSFDGSDDHIEIPDDASLDFGTGDFTLALWLKSSTTFSGGNFRDPITKWGGSEPRWGFQTTSGSRSATVGSADSEGDPFFNWSESSNDTTVSDTTDLDDTNWHHVVVTRSSGGTHSLYIDGSQVSSGSATVRSMDTSAEVWIGELTGGGQNWPGTIDEIRLYSGVKDADWVTSDFDTAPAGGQDLFSWSGPTSTSTTVSATVTDTLGFSESLDQQLEFTQTDSLTFSENLDQELQFTLTDSLVFAENEQFTLQLDVSDSLSFTENQKFTLVTTLTEQLNFTEQEAFTVITTLEDSLAFAETVNFPIELTLTDSLSFSENLTLNTIAAIRLSDSLSFSEEIQQELQFTQTDALVFGEELNQELQFELTDSLAFTENLDLTNVITLEEGLSFSEELDFSLQAEFTDQLLFSEVFNSELQAEFQDQLNFSEDIVQEIQFVVSDSLSFSESVEQVLIITEEETLTFSENIDFTLEQVLSETLAFSESTTFDLITSLSIRLEPRVESPIRLEPYISSGRLDSRMAVDENLILDLGDDKRVEVDVFTSAPHDTEVRDDIDEVKITITDPDGNKKADGAKMTKDGVGEYYYVFETTSSDPSGNYEFKIKGLQGSNEEVESFKIRYR